jgi:hypothetical protein
LTAERRPTERREERTAKGNYYRKEPTREERGENNQGQLPRE